MAKQEYVLKIVLDDGELKVKIPGVVKSTDDLSKAFEKTSASSKKFSKAVKENSKVNEDLISNAGLAGATLTELGRTISDLPFGIRGVANNLSQLSTLFITLVAKSADGGKSITGVAKAFQLLKNQLSGPLGIILIFQAVIAALDFFSQKSKKASDAADLFTNSADRQAQTLQVLLTRIKDTNLALEDRIALLEASTISSSKLSKILNDETLSLEERNKKSERFLELELERIQRQALIEKAEEDLALARQKSEEAIENENKGLEGFIATVNKGTTSADIQAQQTAFLNRKKRESKDATNALAGAETALTTLLIGNAQVIKEQNELLEINKKLKIENLAVDEMTMTFQEAFDGYFNAFEEPFTVSDDLYDNAIDALLEFNRFREQFTEKSELEIIDIMETAALARAQKLAEESDGLIDFEEEKLKIIEFFSNKRQEIINGELDRQLFEVQNMIDRISMALDFLTDAELSREERKTVLLNNQLKERLRNEQLSADQKAAIEKQIENNEIALQKKRDEIAEKNFKLQKAAMIANALVETFRTGILAYGSQLIIGDPTSPIRAQIAQAVAIASGLAQVAAIARTKFVPGSISTGQTGSASAPSQATGDNRPQDPAFNIVGTGQQFQLSQAIAQRTGEPVRAYVVTGDVRSGLALERNIIRGSKLG